MAYKGPSSTTTREGVIRLAGDLGGTFSAPVLNKLRGFELDLSIGNGFDTPTDKVVPIYDAANTKWVARRLDDNDILPPFSTSNFTITNAGPLGLTGSASSFLYEVGHDFTSPSSLLAFSASYVSGPPTSATLRDPSSITTPVSTGGTFSQAGDVTGDTTPNLIIQFAHNATKGTQVAAQRLFTLTSAIKQYWGLDLSATPTINFAYLTALNGTGSGALRASFINTNLPMSIPSANIYFYYASTELLNGTNLVNGQNFTVSASGGGYTVGQTISMNSTPVGTVSTTNPYGVNLTYYVYRSVGALFNAAGTVTFLRTNAT